MIPHFLKQPLTFLVEAFQDVATAPLSKAGVATGLTAAYEIWGQHYLGEASVLYIWAAFFTVSYITYLLRAVVWGTATPAKAIKGVRRFFIHLLTIAIINYICYSFQATSGINSLIIVNLFCFILTLNEAVSIVDNLEKLGMDVPPVLVWVLARWRKRSVKMISAVLGHGDGDSGEYERFDPEFAEAMAKLRGDRRTGRRPDTGERRRERDLGVDQSEFNPDTTGSGYSAGPDIQFEGEGVRLGQSPVGELSDEFRDGSGETGQVRPSGDRDGGARGSPSSGTRRGQKCP